MAPSPTVASSVRMQARSRTLRSSRRLPGQGNLRSRRTAPAVTSGAGRPSLAATSPTKGCREFFDVFEAVAKRRKTQLEQVEPIEEVGAEPPEFDVPSQISSGRGDHGATAGRTSLTPGAASSNPRRCAWSDVGASSTSSTNSVTRRGRPTRVSAPGSSSSTQRASVITRTSTRRGGRLGRGPYVERAREESLAGPRLAADQRGACIRRESLDRRPHGLHGRGTANQPKARRTGLMVRTSAACLSHP